MGHGRAGAAMKEAVAQPEADQLGQAIDEAVAWLASRRADDGHWVFELEADATIPAEYILLNHYLGEIDDRLEGKLAAYLRRTQAEHGGWPLYYDGDIDVSATVKAYYALKLVGDDPDAPHMARARDAILARGGAANANVFTRIALALFGQVPWRAVPLMRVEAMKPRARNPRGVDIPELFVVPPEEQRDYLHNPTGHWLGDIFLLLDRVGRLAEPLIPGWLERKAIDKAMAFIDERMNGEDGLGGIFPAMANAVMALDALGCDRDDPRFQTARRAIDNLLVFNNGHAYCQPCLSPVWDTAL